MGELVGELRVALEVPLVSWSEWLIRHIEVPACNPQEASRLFQLPARCSVWSRLTAEPSGHLSHGPSSVEAADHGNTRRRFVFQELLMKTSDGSHIGASTDLGLELLGEPLLRIRVPLHSGLIAAERERGSSHSELLACKPQRVRELRQRQARVAGRVERRFHGGESCGELIHPSLEGRARAIERNQPCLAVRQPSCGIAHVIPMTLR